MPRQTKKERQRLKRKQKQVKLRREKSLSPFQRWLKVKTPVKCHINSIRNSQGDDMGIASLFVTRDVPGAGKVMMSFLIDFWCLGLKDIIGRPGLTGQEVEDYFDRVQGKGGEIEEVDLKEAIQVVAGAIRFSKTNGFKLPHKFERYTHALGVSEADVANADLGDFRTSDGKLRYIGPMDDLQRRLIGSVADFLSRPDVEYIGEVGGPELGEFWDDQDDGEELFDDYGEDEPGQDGMIEGEVVSASDVPDEGDKK